MEIWVGAPQRVLAQSPIAALVVSLHGTNIHSRYVNADFLEPGDADFVREYLEEQRALQDRLCAATGMARDEAERMGDLLFCLDAISLSLCHGWPERDLPPVDGVELSYKPLDDSTGTLDPWPLATDGLALHVYGKTFAERFDDERALHEAFAAAPWRRLEFALRSA
jgi:hypothetical protein